jgi:lipopolysaccharide/colanic/teichoic acid biosynthesis glycosyltransferase
VRFRNEAEILGASSNPEQTYLTTILPAKIRLSKEYVRQASLRSDLRVILDTLMAVVWDGKLSARPLGPPH